MIRAMIMEPGKHAEVRFICPKKIGELVGGVPEFTSPFKGICIAVNEEGKILGLPLNRSLVDENGDIQDIYAGTMVILGFTDKEEICSLTDEQVQKYSEMFAKPQDISPEEVQSDCGFTFYGW